MTIFFNSTVAYGLHLTSLTFLLAELDYPLEAPASRDFPLVAPKQSLHDKSPAPLHNLLDRLPNVGILPSVHDLVPSMHNLVSLIFM